MDISKLRKKHKEGKGKPEPEESKERPEEVSEPEGLEEKLEQDLEAAEDAQLAEEEPEEETAQAAVEEKPSVAATVPPKPKAPAQDELDEDGGAVGELVELVTFTLADEYYAFRVTGVHEVLRPQYIAKVPRSADFIVGVTSLRGKIIPVMNMRRRLNIEGEFEKAANIVILKGVGKGIIGVIVDRTMDVITVPESEIKLPPSHLVDSEARFIQGVTSQDGKFISVILPDELLNFDASAEGR